MTQSDPESPNSTLEDASPRKSPKASSSWEYWAMIILVLIFIAFFLSTNQGTHGTLTVLVPERTEVIVDHRVRTPNELDNIGTNSGSLIFRITLPLGETQVSIKEPSGKVHHLKVEIKGGASSPVYELVDGKVIKHGD